MDVLPAQRYSYSRCGSIENYPEQPGCVEDITQTQIHHDVISEYARLTAVPYGAGLKRSYEEIIRIANRSIRHAVCPERGDVIFVPADQRRRLAQGKPFEHRCGARSAAHLHMQVDSIFSESRFRSPILANPFVVVVLIP